MGKQSQAIRAHLRRDIVEILIGPHDSFGNGDVKGVGVEKAIERKIQEYIK